MIKTGLKKLRALEQKILSNHLDLIKKKRSRLSPTVFVESIILYEEKLMISGHVMKGSYWSSFFYLKPHIVGGNWAE